MEAKAKPSAHQFWIIPILDWSDDRQKSKSSEAVLCVTCALSSCAFLDSMSPLVDWSDNC